MTRALYWLAIPVACALVSGPTRAAQEAAEEHAKHTEHTVVLDNQDIRPTSITMDAADALVFENQSLRPIVLTFTDPPDMKDKIRCGLVKPTATSKSEAPWQLFAWQNGKLSATIPPGRFASVCSLAEGSYTFVAERQSTNPHIVGGTLPPKGQVVVK